MLIKPSLTLPQSRIHGLPVKVRTDQVAGKRMEKPLVSSMKIGPRVSTTGASGADVTIDVGGEGGAFKTTGSVAVDFALAFVNATGLVAATDFFVDADGFDVVDRLV